MLRLKIVDFLCSSKQSDSGCEFQSSITFSFKFTDSFQFVRRTWNVFWSVASILKWKNDLPISSLIAFYEATILARSKFNGEAAIRKYSDGRWFSQLRTNVAKDWAKLEMVKQNLLSYRWNYTHCGICLTSNKNLHWASGGKFRKKLHFLGQFSQVNISESRLTVKNLFTWQQNIILPLNKNVINFSLAPPDDPCSLSFTRGGNLFWQGLKIDIFEPLFFLTSTI